MGESRAAAFIPFSSGARVCKALELEEEDSLLPATINFPPSPSSSFHPPLYAYFPSPVAVPSSFREQTEESEKIVEGEKGRKRKKKNAVPACPTVSTGKVRKGKTKRNVVSKKVVLGLCRSFRPLSFRY